jgi:hypothetical protein
MTQRERERLAKRHLYSYSNDIDDVTEFENMMFATPKHDESGIRGTGISDPTARIGIALASPPKHIEEKRSWIRAINSALDELKEMDDGSNHGYAYIATKIYGLDGKRHKRRENRDTAIKVADECFISQRTLYYKMRQIINIVIVHAVQHGCFAKEKGVG